MTLDDQLSYECLDTGIHRFTLHHASAQSVTQFLEAVSTLYAETPPGKKLYFLVDLSPEGLPPVNAALRAARQFQRNNADQPPARFAYLYENSALISIAQTMLDILRFSNVQRRFFRAQDETSALEWLLEDMES